MEGKEPQVIVMGVEEGDAGGRMNEEKRICRLK